MPSYPNSPIEEIKGRLDIVEIIRGYLNLQKAGNSYRALCPFHHEKTPSFFVSPERQMFKCFGCGEGGDVLAFVQKIEGLEFRDALHLLAERAGVVLKKEDPKLKSERTRLYEICQLATKFFEKQLWQSKVGKAVQGYLTNERGLKPETVRLFRLGYAPNQWRALSDFLTDRGYTVDEIIKAGLVIEKNDRLKPATQRYYDRFRGRIMFPIADSQGNIIGFTGRVLTEKIAAKFKIDIPANMGKYINTPETLLYHKSRLLYGLDKAKAAIRQRKQALLVEGNMDVILCHQAGFQNALASSGTALSDEQLNIIGRYTKNLLLAFDMDLAGQTATRRSIEMALQRGFDIKVMDLGPAKDPADLIVTDLAQWQTGVNQAKKILEFYFIKTLASLRPNDVESKKQAAATLLPWIKRIPNQIEQAHWLQQLGQRLGVGEVVLRQEMARISLSETRQSVSLQSKNSTIIQEAQGLNFVKLTKSLLGFLILRPQYFPLLKKEPVVKDALQKYLDKTDQQIMAHLGKLNHQTGETYQVLKERLPKEIIDRLEKLAFEAECQYFNDENFNCETEISFCLNQLKNHYLKEQLTALNQQIKQAEAEHHQSILKKLLKEFDKISQQLTTEC